MIDIKIRADAEERGITQQIKSVTQDICNIKTDLAALEARLAPIVTPQYESDSDCSIDEPGENAPMSPVASLLDGLSGELCRIRSRISFLNDNVEI